MRRSLKKKLWRNKGNWALDLSQQVFRPTTPRFGIGLATDVLPEARSLTFTTAGATPVEPCDEVTFSGRDFEGNQVTETIRVPAGTKVISRNSFRGDIEICGVLAALESNGRHAH